MNVSYGSVVMSYIPRKDKRIWPYECEKRPEVRKRERELWCSLPAQTDGNLASYS